jgi:hypothetical protein
VKFLCLALLAASALSAADLLDSEHPRTPKRVWIRRATLAAGCAVSLAFDILTTRRATTAGGESNGVFTNSRSQPQWGRMIVIKAAFCGVSAVLQETHLFRAWQTPGRRLDLDWSQRRRRGHLRLGRLA